MSTEVLDQPVASAWMKMKFGGLTAPEGAETGAGVLGGAMIAQAMAAKAALSFASI
jgi:hypothetical protein